MDELIFSLVFFVAKPKKQLFEKSSAKIFKFLLRILLLNLTQISQFMQWKFYFSPRTNVSYLSLQNVLKDVTKVKFASWRYNMLIYDHKTNNMDFIYVSSFLVTCLTCTIDWQLRSGHRLDRLIQKEESLKYR